MKAADSVNRIDDDIKNLQKEELRLNKLFGRNVMSDKDLIIEKLKFYESLADKYKGLSLSERLSRKGLMVERRRLENLAYGSQGLFQRVLRRILRAVGNWVERSRDLRDSLTKDNVSYISSGLKRTGILKDEGKLSENLQKQKQSFEHSFEQKMNERQKLEVIAVFKRMPNGKYDWVNKAKLYTEGEATPNTYIFSRQQALSLGVEKMYHLLSGRAVSASAEEMGVRNKRELNEAFYQIDFSDRDKQGQYKLKCFDGVKDHLDISGMLKTIGIKETSRIVEMSSDLRDGRLVSATVIHGGVDKQVLLSINPDRKVISACDDQLRPVLLQATKEAKVVRLVVGKQEKVQSKVSPDTKRRPRHGKGIN